MLVPITVIASPRPTQALLRHAEDAGTVVVADRSIAVLDGAEQLVAGGRFTTSDPDVYWRTPGCDCCAVREDLIESLVRATRRTEPPERIVVIVPVGRDDLLMAVSTILSSFEISRRSTLDAVVLHLDAVELATRLTTDVELVDDAVVSALAIADRVVLDGEDQITDEVGRRLRTTLAAQAGFARLHMGDPSDLTRIDAWHGAPDVRPVRSARLDRPATVVLRVDQPLDAQAIEEWLDLVVARHAPRLLRLQGALSVNGQPERTCCYGIRSFATSHSEGDHEHRRSSESVLALCGLELDAEELLAGFRSTVAS